MSESIAFVWWDEHLREELQCIERGVSGTRTSSPTFCDLLTNVAVVFGRNGST